VAWAIHHKSRRKSKPYIKVNCAAVPSELLESEFFGHRKGAFTGAVSDQKGKFMAANGGFPRKIDVRIIAATNKDLSQLVESGSFREDLYHRLNLLHIYIPPLRERTEDILPLIYYFLEKFNQEYNKQVIKIHPLAEKVFLDHPWPGNVRELRNVVERIVVFAEEKEITPDIALKYLTGDISGHHPVFNMDEFNDIIDLHLAHQIFEKNYLKYVLQKLGGKKTEAARRLNIDRTNLYKKLKKHNL